MHSDYATGKSRLGEEFGHPMATVEFLLETKGLTIDEIAARSNLPLERVEAIVVGRWTPSPTERQRIATAMDVTVADISWGHTMDPRNVRYRRMGFKDKQA